MMQALKVAALVFVFFMLLHWFNAGRDDILEGPPETPEHSFVQP